MGSDPCWASTPIVAHTIKARIVGIGFVLMGIASQPDDSATLEIRGVFRVSLSFVMRLQRVGAQRAAAAWKGAPRRGQAVRRDALLDPAHNGSDGVERVERRRTSGTVAHAGRQEQAAPVAELLGP